MRVLATTFSTASAVMVCQTQWEHSFMKDGEHKFSLKGLAMEDGFKKDEGTYKIAAQACQACVKQLVDTKSCTAFAENKCYAYDSKLGFGQQTVEVVEDGKLTTKKIDNDESLDGQWSYVTASKEGGVPEGAEACGPIIYRFSNPDARDSEVDKACASDAKAFCGAQSKFEDCCAGFVPENILCDDGEYCCGQENTITMGANGDECQATSSG